MEEKPGQLSAAIVAFIVLYSGDAKDTQDEMLFHIYIVDGTTLLE